MSRFVIPRLSNGQISNGTGTKSSDGSAYYDTNLAVSLSRDTGVISDGVVHGRNAAFTDQRDGQVFVGATKDYMAGLVRGALTTNNIPLFIPVLRKEVGGAPTPIHEGALTAYETAVQTGIAYTWCGPVYGVDSNLGVDQGLPAVLDAQLISWPTYGVIPFTSYNTNIVSTATVNTGSIILTGAIDMGDNVGSLTTNTTTFVTRLNALFAAAGLQNLQVNAIDITAGGSQFLSFTQLPFTDSVGVVHYPTVVFDFTVPSAVNASVNTLPIEKGGVLQACKMLGFIPNSTFVISPTIVPGPAPPVVTTAPRAYQMGLRSTINLFAYKHARWVPEDTNVPFPSDGEFQDGYTGAYFDCYTYQHMLNQVVNPAFARCITDEYDAQQIFSDQCLNRQLRSVLRGNCNAFEAWSQSVAYQPSTLLSTVSVLHNGFAYLSQYASGGAFPVQEPGTGTAWVSCGESIRNSWSPTVKYYLGDVVTYCLDFPVGNTFRVWICANSLAPAGIPPSVPNWTVLGSANSTSNAVATGGTVSVIGNRRFHTFTGEGGIFNFTASALGGATLFDVFGVGGGGGGGASGGGGGGGNVILAQSPSFSSAVTRILVVRPGGGGSGGIMNVVPAQIAGPGSITTVVDVTPGFPQTSVMDALGGGGGGTFNTNAGQNGGSGGGGSYPVTTAGGAAVTGTVDPSYTTLANLAFAGGIGDPSLGPPAGGGGAGGAGLSPAGPGDEGGNGGPGFIYSVGIGGTGLTYGGGGGGSSVINSVSPTAGGVGGSGGGGQGAPYIFGSNPNPANMAGTVSTGGGGGGASFGSNDPPNPVGGTGGDGVVVISYVFTDQYVLTPNNATVGTLPPTISFNSSTSLFTLNLDSYGFGGTQLSNADDGYNGRNDDPGNPAFPERQVLNSSYNDHARDSWGLTGTSFTLTTQPYYVARGANQCYDERMVIEANDYFHSLFGNWPVLRLQYLDPRTNLQTAYVRYLPQASLAGLNVPTPLPLFVPTVVTSGYLPYGRVAGNQIYLYTFPQDYPSIGNMWNPVDAIVVTTGITPIEDDYTMAPTILGDTAYSRTSSQTTSNQSKKILAEFVVRHPGNLGQEYRSEIIYDPQVRTMVDMQTATDFKQFEYQFNIRLKQSQILRRLGLPDGGSVNMRVIFERKRPREV